MHKWQSVVLAISCAAFGQSAIAGSFLTPGPIGPACGSFLTPGNMIACLKKQEVKKAAKKKIKQPKKPPENSLESREKAFYKNYGKPPKAAASALLDPTPEHIKAWALQAIRQQENATEVAAALTREEKKLMAQKTKIPPLLAMESKIPNYYGDGMKIVMWGEPPKLCPGCAAEEQVIQAIATENPNITVSEDLVGAGSLQAAIRYAANSWFDFNVNPKNKKEAELAGIREVPSLVITDTEYHRGMVIDGTANMKTIKDAIIALRKRDMSLRNKP
ncbi:hypothetical protein B1757_13200 [Acidithiobacillus marinus]|uniref:Thioredoxin-like fold domain-containing protein n=1 Tax=Acidithiobacillus marinus TaxID=187490 RepID=A0A2I1DIP5_9PROT|nr:hypothetical protein [Acidithiobacillus marinus]PKY09751.1 hypothetical protein B1757_13200 [Acidithiobacillus marinus]